MLSMSVFFLFILQLKDGRFQIKNKAKRSNLPFENKSIELLFQMA